MRLRNLSQPSTGDRRKSRAKPGRKPGRPKGGLSKRTIETHLKAQRELLEAANYKVATEHMDQQIGWLEGLTALLNPFDESGKVKEGMSASLYFRAFELYRDFLCMRAPYQSPRLSAVRVMPQQSVKRTTTVNVTILNEHGEKVFSDAPEESELKQIEHVGSEDEAA